MTVKHEIKSQLAKLLATEDLMVEHKNVETAQFNVHTRVLQLPNWNTSNRVYDSLVAHEVGHALFTPDVDPPKSVPHTFINITEDARIEKLMKRKYMGLAKTFYRGYNELADNDFFEIDGKDLDTLNLADRVNLYFKIGSFVNISFSSTETPIVNLIKNAETFEEAVSAAEALYNFCKQTEEESDNESSGQNQQVSIEQQPSPSGSSHTGDSDTDSTDNIDSPIPNTNGDDTTVRTYDLGSPFDVTSMTLVHTLDLTSTVLNTPAGLQRARDINFNDTGSAAYILIHDNENPELSAIYQFRLEKNYDMSTASLVGSAVIDIDGRDYGHLEGFEFGDGGMKLYVIDSRGGDLVRVDRTNVYQLECPYGVVECVSNPTASIGSQVELVKQNIDLNISSIFRRFEWIKRNRDGENFTSHNININYPNPLLKSLAMSLEPAAKEKLATFVSTKKKDQKKSKWSSWSLADLSLSHFDKLGFENAKNIRNEGITFGADRKFSDNKFFGWAIRYGNGRSNIFQTKQED